MAMAIRAIEAMPMPIPIVVAAALLLLGSSACAQRVLANPEIVTEDGVMHVRAFAEVVFTSDAGRASTPISN